jgi:hypothetical protein
MIQRAPALLLFFFLLGCPETKSSPLHEIVDAAQRDAVVFRFDPVQPSTTCSALQTQQNACEFRFIECGYVSACIGQSALPAVFVNSDCMEVRAYCGEAYANCVKTAVHPLVLACSEEAQRERVLCSQQCNLELLYCEARQAQRYGKCAGEKCAQEFKTAYFSCSTLMSVCLSVCTAK